MDKMKIDDPVGAFSCARTGGPLEPSPSETLLRPGGEGYEEARPPAAALRMKNPALWAASAAPEAEVMSLTMSTRFKTAVSSAMTQLLLWATGRQTNWRQLSAYQLYGMTCLSRGRQLEPVIWPADDDIARCPFVPVPRLCHQCRLCQCPFVLVPALCQCPFVPVPFVAVAASASAVCASARLFQWPVCGQCRLFQCPFVPVQCPLVPVPALCQCRRCVPVPVCGQCPFVPVPRLWPVPCPLVPVPALVASARLCQFCASAACASARLCQCPLVPVPACASARLCQCPLVQCPLVPVPRLCQCRVVPVPLAPFVPVPACASAQCQCQCPLVPVPACASALECPMCQCRLCQVPANAIP
uniref:Keratin-associated protein 10-12-like n=1 Tax=Macrostomum lignano TaxID=282301 RepID=A0A1I8FAK5_9PLAT